MSHIATAWAFNQSGISTTAKLVLIFLADFHNHQTNLCFPSRATLAAKCCCDEKTITRAIQELASVGMISYETRKEKSGRQTSHTYTLHISMGQIVHGEVDKLSPLEPVITNQDSDTSYRAEPPDLDFTDLLEDPPPETKEDISKAFWDEAVGMLLAMGLADVTARSWIGKCLKMANGDQARVMEVLQDALDTGTMDPVRYMAAALGGKKAKKKREIDDAFAELRAASDRRKAQWAAEERDDTGGGSGDDLLVLPPEPVPEPVRVRKDSRKSVGAVPPRRTTEIVRPNAWDSKKSKVPPIDSGTDRGSAEHSEAF